MQDRFNWNNIPSPKKTGVKKKLGQKSTDEDNSQISQIPSAKYNYVVDTTEKPQDPGTVNKLC